MDDKIAKEITLAEYMKMYDTVINCNVWHKRIKSMIGYGFADGNTVMVSKDFLKEMREAARTEGTQKHIDVLNEVFGEEATQPKFKVGDWVRIVKEWWTLNKGDVYQITSIAAPDDRNKKHPYRYYFNDGEFSSIGGDEVEPWIPEVGEWVVARGEDKAEQVNIVFKDSIVTTKCNSYPFNSYYLIEHLRPATKEEVEKAKGEDMLFTGNALNKIADLISNDLVMGFRSWDKLPGEKSIHKAQWINKTITKALKDEGLW